VRNKDDACLTHISATEGLAGRRKEEVFGFGVRAWCILYMMVKVLDVVHSVVLL
jgi:hypothetical protein